MIAILIIIGVFIYLVIGRVVVNYTEFIDPYSSFNEIVVNFIITIGWPLVLFYGLAKFIGDWING